MPFTDLLNKFAKFDVEGYCASTTVNQVERAINKSKLNEYDFLALLSPAAQGCLEQMAVRARDLTKKHFGNVIFLFTPIYVSNICDNFCPYCSFAHQNKIERIHLDANEIRHEARRISGTGLRHILMLTGESRKGASTRYLKESVKVLKEYFSAIAIEVYPLEESEYAQLVDAGVDGLTIYQETYNRENYADLHKGGPKQSFDFRLLAPQRACAAGMRSVTVGPLLGLGEPVKEVFLSGLHARHIQNTFPSVEVSVSFPRLRPQVGIFEPRFTVGDKQFVQFMTAFKIFMPNAGFTVSTRESAQFRDSVLPLGVTKMSAGVSTSVGGRSEKPSEPQFEISDSRTVEQMQKSLRERGFAPVMHDWNFSLTRDSSSFID
ncbi:MAG: 2-iminoacetate synthase ThiH [Chitinispirillales bacterium]|jgi:2-iminoacetate synthase|nr:2-iminoacetate synthase ThiH [Chitinispirillales bacterium]